MTHAALARVHPFVRWLEDRTGDLPHDVLLVLGERLDRPQCRVAMDQAVAIISAFFPADSRDVPPVAHLSKGGGSGSRPPAASAASAGEEPR